MPCSAIPQHFLVHKQLRVATEEKVWTCKVLWQRWPFHMQIEGSGPTSISVRNVGTLKFCNSNWNICHYPYSVEIQTKFQIFYSFQDFFTKEKNLMWSPINLPIFNPVSAIKLLQIFMKSGLRCFAKSFQASLCLMHTGFFTGINKFIPITFISQCCFHYLRGKM